jgi:hypothetical protein
VTPNLGRILEFRLDPDGRKVPRIGCDPKLAPPPGRYLVAGIPGDAEIVLPPALFSQAILPDGFLAAPLEVPVPASWNLGTELALRGPLGKAFQLPGIIRNLALAAAGDTAARLLPLIEDAGSAALFTDLPVPDLPTRVEVQPLSALPEALGWADFLAVDIPLEQADTLPALLGGPDARPIPPGQALVHGPMPCSGLAECGVCTLKTGRKSILLCEDGPVVDLKTLLTA